MGARGLLLIVSSPSGAGKTTLCRRLMADFPAIRFSVSVTTRAPRVGEVDGVDYRFVSATEFQAMIDRSELMMGRERVVALETPSQMWSARWDRQYVAPRVDCSTFPAPTISCRVTRKGISPSEILENSPAREIRKFSWQP